MANRFEVNFKFEVKEVTRYLNAVQKKAVPMAEVQALNRVARTTLSRVVKDIAQRSGAKQKDIRAKIKLIKAQRSRRTAVLDARQAKATNLIEYVRKSQRTPKYFRQRSKAGKFKFSGVVATVAKKRVTYKGAFIGTSGSGELRVYKRTNPGNPRSKPTLISGPSPRLIFKSPRVFRLMEKTAQQRWPIEFDRALKNQLRMTR